MLEDEALGVFVDMRYAWTWRQNVDVTIEKLQLETSLESWQSALRYVIEPIRHSGILLPDIRICLRPGLTSRLEKVHVPLRLDLTHSEQIECRVEVL